MIHKLLLAVLFSLTASVAVAQVPVEPPALDDPSHWEIRDQNGAIGFDIYVDFLFSQDGCDYFVMYAVGTVNGEPFISVSYAMDCHCGPVIVINGDSGNTTEWHWNNDHYVKVGGTPHHREFHPIH